MKGYDLQVFVLLLPNHIAHVSLALLDADHVNARHRQVFRWLCPLSLLMNATSLNFYYIYIYIYIYIYVCVCYVNYNCIPIQSICPS